MPDTISSLLQVLLMADGGHGSDWGGQTNINLLKLEAAISGQNNFTVSGGALTLSDDEARAAILVFSGTPGSAVTIVVPNRQKTWTIINNTFLSLNLQSTAGINSVVIPPASSSLYSCAAGGGVYLVSPPIPTDTGKMSMFAGSSAPLNHLLCNGQQVSRTTYAALFSIIGTTYGAGNGSTTFNVPDMRGLAPVGLDNMGGSARGVITTATLALGQVFGEQVHTLTLSEIPSHAHTVSDPGHAHSISDPGHSHTIVMQTGAINTGTVPVSVPINGTSNTSTNTTGIGINGAGTGITVQANGGGVWHNNLQPSIFLNFIIRI